MRIRPPLPSLRAAALLVAFALGTAGCDDFAEVQKADSIEAYETWLAEHGEASSQARMATQRLRELYLDRARKGRDVSGYDRWLDRFGKDPQASEIRKEREEMLFGVAEEAGTEAGWQAFLSACPDANVKHKEAANEGLAAARYSGKLSIGPVAIERVNLARDPKGELNGTAFTAPVTNNGETPLAVLWFNVLMLDAEGKVVQREDGPLAAPATRGRIRKELQAPLQPGETRTFYWATDTLPAGFAQQVRLVPSRLVPAEPG